MVKTRSSSSNLVKTEEEPSNERRPTQVLHEASTVTNSRVSKRNSRSSHPLDGPQIKLEESNNKHLLRLSPKKGGNRRWITVEQVEQLIRYVEDDNLTVSNASKKVNINSKSGYKYYRMYKNDPEKRIPVPRFGIVNPPASPSSSPSLSPPSSPVPEIKHESTTPGQKPSIKSMKETWVTQEQINKLIHCIETKKMSIHAAAGRAKLGPVTAYKYYHRYKDEGKIPQPRSYTLHTISRCTQDQIKDLIHYVENDKLSLNAASARVRMSHDTSKKYYTEYQKTGRIPMPKNRTSTYCTFEQKRILIDFLFNDKMTLQEASLNANMTEEAGIKYYSKQLVEPGRHIPAELKDFIGPYTNEQIKDLIGYVVDDKMSVEAALGKVGTGEDS